MTRPLLIIFLTIFVDLVGFGIIIPLLPFYAETFGASPFVVGLLFAIFSLCQLVASPALGDLSDRWGRRPILVFSLAGTVLSFVMLALAHSLAVLFIARAIDGLSGGNISTARAYVADVTDVKDRSHAYGLLGAAFGLGFIFGPALSGVLANISYTAPIWAAAGLTLIATIMAWAWLPETVHRVQASAGNPLRFVPEMLSRPIVRRVLAIDFLFWFSFSIFQTTFALFTAARFGFDAVKTGYYFAAFGLLGAFIQGGFIRRLARQWGDRKTFVIGSVIGVVGLAASGLTHSLTLFAVMLVPVAIGMSFGMPTIASLISRAAQGHEQGRIQGSASAVESLSRTLGPVWGTAFLQGMGEASPFVTAAAFLLLTAVLGLGYRMAEPERAVAGQAN